MRVNLPVKYKGSPVQIVYENKSLRVVLQGVSHIFVVNRRLLYIIIFLLVLIFTYQLFAPRYQGPTVLTLNGKEYNEDMVGYFLDYFEEVNNAQPKGESLEEDFLVRKQMLISRMLIRHKVSRLDQLPDRDLLLVNKQISQLYLTDVLPQLTKEAHVLYFFTDSVDLHKIETALMEQAKYNLPASIKLAQSALETGYGTRVVHNNYFGIKDKKQSTERITTTEYYTEEEVKLNQKKIVSKEKIVKNGRTLYKCLITDSFEAYQTPWESFRAHSLYLKNQPRYAPLFTEGKNYQAWADKIGSTKYGGVGYATSPVYGQLLKKIIERYKLHLLDH